LLVAGDPFGLANGERVSARAVIVASGADTDALMSRISRIPKARAPLIGASPVEARLCAGRR